MEGILQDPVEHLETETTMPKIKHTLDGITGDQMLQRKRLVT